MEEMKYAVQVVLLNDEGEVLCVSRKDDHNDFGLVGGKVDPEDNGDFEAAAIRETKEETGLDISNLRLIYAKHWEGYMGFTYLADWEGEIHTEEPHVVGWDGFRAVCEGSFYEWNEEVRQSMASAGIDFKYELNGNLFTFPEDEPTEGVDIDEFFRVLDDIVLSYNSNGNVYLQHAVKCHKCNSIIISRDLHDNKYCSCGNCSISGGLKNNNRLDGEENTYTSLTVKIGASLEERAEKLVWGTRGKDGDQPLKYVLLKDCETDHLEAILDTQDRAANHITDTIAYILKERRKQ